MKRRYRVNSAHVSRELDDFRKGCIDDQSNSCTAFAIQCEAPSIRKLIEDLSRLNDLDSNTESWQLSDGNGFYELQCSQVECTTGDHYHRADDQQLAEWRNNKRRAWCVIYSFRLIIEDYQEITPNTEDQQLVDEVDDLKLSRG